VGICTIIFGPEVDDLGQWSCIFTINDWEIASATLVLLTTPPGKPHEITNDVILIILGP
jgi:hypothetical protein